MRHQCPSVWGGKKFYVETRTYDIRITNAERHGFLLIISGFKDSLILSAKISITDTEDNAKQAILIAKNILYTFVVNKNLLQTNMYSYLLSKVLDRALNEVPLLYETFTIPLPPGRLYFLRLKKTP